MARGSALIGMVLAVVPIPSFADSWASATAKAIASDSGEFLVRVTPGNSIGDTIGFAGSPKGKYASAEWFRYRGDRYELFQTAELVNPVAPIQFAVANDGTLVTLDNWHNVGYGDVVVIYGSDARMRRRYRLPDLFSKATIEKIDQSVSSIWWRCIDRQPSIAPKNTLQVDDRLGGRFTFRLDTGQYTHEPGIGACRKNP
jgi:hypothetical protein